MTIVFSSSTKRVTPKKYLIGGTGRRFAYADTLTEAKIAGAKIAKAEAWHGSWNVMFISVPILRQDALGSTRYEHTGWRMYVPVRGSGKTASHIVSAIRQRHGVAPFVWTRS